jgi:hypothetical protein
MSEPILRVVNLEKKFPIQRGMFKRTAPVFFRTQECYYFDSGLHNDDVG